MAWRDVTGCLHSSQGDSNDSKDSKDSKDSNHTAPSATCIALAVGVLSGCADMNETQQGTAQHRATGFMNVP
jgi:hypothetical protein